MKRVLVILVAFVFCLVLSACGSGNETVVETSPPFQEYTMVLTSTPAPEAEESNEVPEFIYID